MGKHCTVLYVNIMKLQIVSFLALAAVGLARPNMEWHAENAKKTLEGAVASLPININQGQLQYAINSAVQDFKWNNQDKINKAEKIAAKNVNVAVNQAKNAFTKWFNSQVQNKDGKQLAKKISNNLTNQLKNILGREGYRGSVEDVAAELGAVGISKAREYAAQEGLGYKLEDAAQSIADAAAKLNQ